MGNILCGNPPILAFSYKGYGFTVRDIDTSCPADLQPYADAYNLDKKQRDNEMWMWFGTYGLSAVSVAVEHCLAGRKAKSKYIENQSMSNKGKMIRK